MGGNEERGFTPEYGRLIRTLAGSTLFGVAVTLVLLLLVSAAMSQNRLPAELNKEYVITAAFTGATVTGAVAVKKQGRGKILTGIYAGIMLTLITKIIAILIPEGAVTGESGIKMAICCIAGGAFGGALGMYKKNKKRARRRR